MARIDIPFIIEGQSIKQWPVVKIAAGGQNYFYATFTVYDNIWGNIDGIKASFKCNTMDNAIIMDLVQGPNNSMECQIPWEVMSDIGYFDTGVFGGNRIPTTTARTFVIEGCVCDGDTPRKPSEDWFAKIENELKSKLGEDELQDTINDALTQAKESGEFDGKPGKDGNSGVYLGSGDMPDYCNVQIDPDGDFFTAEELVKEVLAALPDGDEVSY